MREGGRRGAVAAARRQPSDGWDKKIKLTAVEGNVERKPRVSGAEENLSVLPLSKVGLRKQGLAGEL